MQDKGGTPFFVILYTTRKWNGFFQFLKERFLPLAKMRLFCIIFIEAEIQIYGGCCTADKIFHWDIISAMSEERKSSLYQSFDYRNSRGIYTENDYKPFWTIRNGNLVEIKPKYWHKHTNINRSEDFRTSRQQQCTCKLSYSNKMDSHKRMLERYLLQKNKKGVIEKPELFGNVTLEQYKKKMVDKHFKWIFSPEEKLDVKTLQSAVKAWMEKLENITESKYIWVAAVHEDTEHPHAHILINGKSRNGKVVRFPREVVKNTAREEAKELLTNILGPRSDALLKAANDNRIFATRLTELDKFIHKFEVPIENDERYGSSVNSMSDPTYQRRLEFLDELELAKYKDGKYYFEKNWMETLKTLGRYNTFLDARRFINKTESYRLKLYTEDVGSIKGTVRHYYQMDDESVWTNAYVIETDKGEGYYVPLFNPPNTWLLNKPVEIHLEKSQKGKLFPTVTRLDGGPSEEEKQSLKREEERKKALEEEAKMFMTF